MQSKSTYSCSKCSHESSKWLGCCPQCDTWNSFAELEVASTNSFGIIRKNPTKPVSLHLIENVKSHEKSRLKTGINEWDQVMGGGILPGSFLILTGDPGVGKSTILLQVANKIAKNHKVIYFSSEESLSQVKNRSCRLGLPHSQVLFSDEHSIEHIVATIENQKPALAVIDSIQSCHFATRRDTLPGSISQLRESAFALMRTSKACTTSILITGHITKDGSIAGPKLLEHMVDGVFYLQGENRWQTRILRAVKNRFGTVNEVGFFEMGQHGMEEIHDINQRMLSEATFAPGSTLICSTEGSRPLLLEAQALCIESRFGSPQRVITGIDHKRVVLIAAILEKYLHVKLSSNDIFFKVGGGVFVREAASDLGIALALLSSYFQQPLPPKSMALGELSLTGHIRPASHAKIMATEAIKFGISTIMSAKDASLKGIPNLEMFKNVYELLRIFPENT